jgi:Mn-dependent DtxR family transcriptional regulator
MARRDRLLSDVPTTLEDQILKSLRALTVADRPATFNDLARQFGVNARLVSAVGQRLVAEGLAEPSYVTIHGERKMFGLLPQPRKSVD